MTCARWEILQSGLVRIIFFSSLWLCLKLWCFVCLQDLFNLFDWIQVDRLFFWTSAFDRIPLQALCTIFRDRNQVFFDEWLLDTLALYVAVVFLSLCSFILIAQIFLILRFMFLVRLFSHIFFILVFLVFAATRWNASRQILVIRIVFTCGVLKYGIFGDLMGR